MKGNLTDSSDGTAIVIEPCSADDLADWLSGQESRIQNWVNGSGFTGTSGSNCLIPDADGNPTRLLLGATGSLTHWDFGALAGELPKGRYTLSDAASPELAAALALGWGLGAYRFDRYKKIDAAEAELTIPGQCDPAQIGQAIDATYLVRDLINTPPQDMGPTHLAEAATELGKTHGAEVTVIIGDDLLTNDYPAIHAVGRASHDAPRLIDLRWGDEAATKITLVGKGVCFDTGGLDLKSAAGMRLMKKDMGGAAHVLGVASMVMAANLPVRLRVLIPAVENSVSGNAYRPSDVIPTRKGLTVEIGNTDAEGRVVLSDALAEADSESPAMIVDFATLTGAARVALGTELPALFCNSDELANQLTDAGTETDDPMWRLPLWPGYRKMIEGKTGDINNAPEGGFAGAITAALFLEKFVSDDTPWAHFDIMAWNQNTKPGRPEGGEAMAMRAVFTAIAKQASET